MVGKKNTLIASSIFLLVIILFNFTQVKEFFSANKTAIEVNDVIYDEFIVEESYQSLLHLKNPFIIKKAVLYPFVLNISLNDPTSINAVYFLFLRLFLSTHKSYIVIVFINIFLSCFLMYVLLKCLYYHEYLSVFFALVFGFTPFLSYQINAHYSYIALYVFPLALLSLLLFLRARDKIKKTSSALLLGVVFVSILFTNFYYFLTLLFAILFYGVYFLLLERKIFSKYLTYKNIGYISFTIYISFFLLIPWLKGIYELKKFNEMIGAKGFGGAVELSADLFNFITPSQYNPFYKYIMTYMQHINFITKKIGHFYFNNWERFTYPGIIIYVSLVLYIVYYKKLSLKQSYYAKLYLFGALFLAMLTLGPFLKIFNRWSITLDEGIAVVMPLPFLLLHYMFGMSGLRAPMRFTPGYVFFAVLFSAVILQLILKKLSARKRVYLYIFLIIIFIIDQSYIRFVPITMFYSSKSYELIRSDKKQNTVLEIPFTVRDGFQYIGDVHATVPIKGYLEHHKPVIGGYLARLNPYVFDYYRNLPFIGYVAQIIDKGNYNPYTEQPKNPIITPFDHSTEDVVKELDFLNIRYIVLKNNEIYTKYITKIIADVGYKHILQDQEYDLYIKKKPTIYFNVIDFGSTYDYLSVVGGLSKPIESRFRYVNDEIVRLFIKSEYANKFEFTGESARQGMMKVYINKKDIGTIALTQGKQTYALPINETIESGINEIILKVQKKDINNLKLYSLKVI